MGFLKYLGTARPTYVATHRPVPPLEFAPNPNSDDHMTTLSSPDDELRCRAKPHDDAAVEFVSESSSPLGQLQVNGYG